MSPRLGPGRGLTVSDFAGRQPRHTTRRQRREGDADGDADRDADCEGDVDRDADCEGDAGAEDGGWEAGVVDGGALGESVAVSGVGAGVLPAGAGDCSVEAGGADGVAESGTALWGRGSSDRECGRAECDAERDGSDGSGEAVRGAAGAVARGAEGAVDLPSPLLGGLLGAAEPGAGDRVGTGRPAVASGPVPPIGRSACAAVGRVRSVGWWFSAAKVRPPPTSVTAAARTARRRVFLQRVCSRRRAARPLPVATSAGGCGRGAIGGGADLPPRDGAASSSPGRRTAYVLGRTGIGARSGEAQSPQPGQTRAPFRCRRQAEQ
ncbi:hypothetical protein [Streptomyces sp. NPDC027717]|uniref:hypothetical protein n=1 Tax=Streptomyces sp. NPDC027717 TaxID=3155765 RepID=UPI0033CA1E6D